jgi:hypothetical protein
MNSIELSEEQLQMVEAMGATGFTPDEICEVLEVPYLPFMYSFKEGGTLYQRYRKGFLQGQFELRQRIMKDAKHGSSPAQTLMKKIFDDADYQLKQI